MKAQCGPDVMQRRRGDGEPQHRLGVMAQHRRIVLDVEIQHPGLAQSVDAAPHRRLGDTGRGLQLPQGGSTVALQNRQQLFIDRIQTYRGARLYRRRAHRGDLAGVQRVCLGQPAQCTAVKAVQDAMRGHRRYPGGAVQPVQQWFLAVGLFARLHCADNLGAAGDQHDVGGIGPLPQGFGELFGSGLLEHFWWGSIFLVNVPIAAVTFLAAWTLAPNTSADRSKNWDLLSALLAMLTLAALVVAIDAAVDRSTSVTLVAAGILILGAATFAARERRISYPLLALELFGHPRFLVGLIAAAVAMFTLGGVQLVSAQRFQLIAGLGPLHSGVIVAAAAAAAIPTALIGGAILQRVGFGPLITGGLAVAAAGVLVMILGLHHGSSWLIAGLIINGAGLGAVMSVASTAMLISAPLHRAGIASFVEETSYKFGNLVSVALLGSMLTAVYTAAIELPADAPPDAGRTVANTLHVAAQTEQPQRHVLLSAAQAAFDTAHLFTLGTVAAILAAAATATAVLLRHNR